MKLQQELAETVRTYQEEHEGEYPKFSWLREKLSLTYRQIHELADSHENLDLIVGYGNSGGRYEIEKEVGGHRRRGGTRFPPEPTQLAFWARLGRAA